MKKAELLNQISTHHDEVKLLNRTISEFRRDKDGQRNNIIKMGKELLNVQAENEGLTNAVASLESTAAASKSAINALNDELEIMESDKVKFKAMLQMLIGGKYLKKVDVENAADFLRFVDWY